MHRYRYQILVSVPILELSIQLVLVKYAPITRHHYYLVLGIGMGEFRNASTHTLLALLILKKSGIGASLKRLCICKHLKRLMELDCILRNTYLSTRVLCTIMSFSPNFDQSTQLLVLRADLFRVLFCFVLSQTNQIGSHMAAQILCLIQSTDWSRIRQVPAQDHCHAGSACWECQCSWKHFRSSSLLIVRILSAREKWQGPRTSICHPWKYCLFVFGGLCLGHMVFSMIWYMVYLMILIGLTLFSLKSAMWNTSTGHNVQVSFTEFFRFLFLFF